MKLRFLAASLAIFALSGAAHAQQQGGAPAALLAAVAATQNAKVAYGFDYNFTSAQASVNAHFDPTTTPHLHLLDADETQLRGDQRQMLNQLRQQIDGLSWCASERMGHIANAQVLREDANTATYNFQPTTDSMRGQAAQYASNLRGEVTLTKANPDVLGIRISAPRPFSPMLMTNVTRVDVAIVCALAPNGRRYAAQTTTRVSGSALGQNFDQINVQRVTSVAPP
jgi:hypothetical protein